MIKKTLLTIIILIFIYVISSLIFGNVYKSWTESPFSIDESTKKNTLLKTFAPVTTNQKRNGHISIWLSKIYFYEQYGWCSLFRTEKLMKKSCELNILIDSNYLYLYEDIYINGGLNGGRKTISKISYNTTCIWPHSGVVIILVPKIGKSDTFNLVW